MYGPDPAVAWEAYSYEFWYYARRVFWLLMFGGVFDRHPDLKLVIGENNAGWVPGVLGEMEAHLDVFWHTPATHKHQLADQLAAGLLAAAHQRCVNAPVPVLGIVRLEQGLHPFGGGLASVFVLVRPWGRGGAAGVAHNVRGGRRCAAVIRPSE
jgi:hypothetical protein